MAGNDYGGRIILSLSTGVKFSMRGTFSVDPASQSNESVVNQDGSNDRVGTVTAPGFEFNFADAGINYDELMRAPRFNATAIEEFTGVTHYWTGCFVVGKPTLNRANGEVSGLSGSSTSYNRSNG